MRHQKVKTEVIPVIHIQDWPQALQNVRICMKAGAKKVMLISMEGHDDFTEAVAREVKAIYPDLWVGANFLMTTPFQSLTQESTLDAIWTDQYPIPPRTGISLPEKVGCNMPWAFRGTYMAGVAFKGQRQPPNLVEATQLAAQLCGVVVTSGEGTGKETDPSKVKYMHGTLLEMATDCKLAVASGVNIGNVKNYVGVADYLLVGTSLYVEGDGREMIDPEKLKALIQACDKALKWKDTQRGEIEGRPCERVDSKCGGYSVVFQEGNCLPDENGIAMGHVFKADGNMWMPLLGNHPVRDPFGVCQAHRDAQ